MLTEGYIGSFLRIASSCCWPQCWIRFLSKQWFFTPDMPKSPVYPFCAGYCEILTLFYPVKEKAPLQRQCREAGLWGTQSLLVFDKSALPWHRLTCELVQHSVVIKVNPVSGFTVPVFKYLDLNFPVVCCL